MNPTVKSLLMGLWMSALFWPFPHSGGYLHPAILSLTPLWLSLADFLPHWILRAVYWVVVLYVELSIAWATLASWHWLRLVIGGAIHKLLALPVADWNQMSAHLAAPLMLIGGFVGWFLFRHCRTYGQVILLFILGTVIIAIDHVLWHLPAELPLAAYLSIGLFVLAYFHRQYLPPSPKIQPRSQYRYALWVAIALLPLIVGWQMPSEAAHNPLSLFHGSWFPSISPLGSAQTGYGPGVTQIGHPLVANQAPVFVARSASPHYWQAATYDYFNGTSWSNSGPSSIYSASPSDSGIPLITPNVTSSVPEKILHVSISDLSSSPFDTLFYSGVPTQFSVSVSVHPRSQRFMSPHVSRYTVTALEPQFYKNTLQSQPFSKFPKSLGVDLQLPSNLSSRVSRLASQITANATGPWIAAEEIKTYLDAHYRYSYHVTPTRHGNVVNHFLFVNRQGYCDQFSTTFIMMMRSLHVPARWVVGYSAGTYDNAKHGYLVRAVDAHSWAEIWVSRVGWVPFDPTPGFSVPVMHANPSSVGAQSSGGIPTPRIPNTLPKVAARSPLLARLHGSGGATGQRHPQSPAVVHPFPWIDIAAIIFAVAAALAVVQFRKPTKSPSEALWSHIATISRRRLGTRWTEKSPRQWGQEWIRYFPEDKAVIVSMVRLLENSFYRSQPLTQEELHQLDLLWEQLKKAKHRGAS